MTNDRRNAAPGATPASPAEKPSGGIALKGAPGVGQGGIRSPLAALGRANAAPASVGPKLAVPAATVEPGPGPTSSRRAPLPGAAGAAGAEATPGAPPKQKGVSISGLDHSEHFPSGTPLSRMVYGKSVRYAHGGSSRVVGRSIAKALLALLTAAAAGMTIVFPVQRDHLIAQLVTAKERLVTFARHRKPRVTHQAYTREAEERPEPDVDEPAPAREVRAHGTTRHTCADLINLATERDASLTVAQRVDLANCYLLEDDAVSAESSLKPLQSKLERTPEPQLNNQKGDRPLADAFLTLLATDLKEGKTRDASDLIHGRCLRWEQTTTCVGKAMLYVDRRLVGTDGGDGSLQMMFARDGVLDGKTQARLWLAGAQQALQEGRLRAADKRYALALAAAPKDAVALRKQIYETEAVDLYARGEVVTLKATVSKALDDLKSVDPGARIKLKALYDLSTAKDKAKAVHALLTREEITYHARSDIDLIDILGTESIRNGQTQDYVALVQRTRDYYTGKYRSPDPTVPRRLLTWQIRAALAEQTWDAAHTLIAQYDKQFGPDALSHHLHGIAYASQSPNARFQTLAAKEFQTAYKLHADWESLDALGLAMIRSGHPEQVAPIIKDLARMITTKGQKYWLEMLKAEWYLATGKYLDAQKILKTSSDADPDRWTPRALQLQLYRKLGKKADAMQAQAALDDLARTERYATSFEGFASPMGVMALAQRPLD